MGSGSVPDPIPDPDICLLTSGHSHYKHVNVSSPHPRFAAISNLRSFMNDDITTTIRASKALLNRIDDLARRDGGLRSRSEAIRWVLNRGVEALESELNGGAVPPPMTDLSTEIVRLQERVTLLERRG